MLLDKHLMPHSEESKERTWKSIMHLKHQHVPSLWIPFILIIIIILKTFNIKLSLYRQEKILKQGKGDAVYTINTQSAAAFAFLPKTIVIYLKQLWIHRSLVTSSRAEVPRGEKSQRGWAGSASSSARTADQMPCGRHMGSKGTSPCLLYSGRVLTQR